MGDSISHFFMRLKGIKTNISIQKQNITDKRWTYINGKYKVRQIITKTMGHIHTLAAAAVASVVPNSVRPHRRQPTRLPRPWDSPGKTTGVGCHFLLQCRKVKSESEVAQSCPILHDPMDCSPPGSSAHGIFQARVLEWGAIAFSNTHSYTHTNITKVFQRKESTRDWLDEQKKPKMILKIKNRVN